jgi:aminoglycoside phosphotransferase (APT) family kinase protein
MERRFETISVTSAEIEDALRSVYSPNCRITSIEPIGEGKINTNLRVNLADTPEPILVRLYARGEGIRAKEAGIYRHLAVTGIPSPALLADTTGQTLAGHPFAVLSFLPGVSLAHLLSDGLPGGGYGLGASVGATVASIHAIEFPRSGDLGADFQPVPWDFGGHSNDENGDEEDIVLVLYRLWVTEGNAGRRLGDDLRERLTRFVHENRPASSDGYGDRPRLVHSDCNPTNLLADPATGAVTGVVDWEWAHVGTPLMDLANLLRDDDLYPPAFVSGILDGYQRVAGPLPSDWKRQARFIDLSSQLEFLNSVEERPEIHGRAIERIEKTLREW